MTGPPARRRRRPPTTRSVEVGYLLLVGMAANAERESEVSLARAAGLAMEIGER